MINLDYLAARYGQDAVCSALHAGIPAADIENSIQAAAEILSQQGVYAMFLWLHDGANRQKRLFIAERLDALMHEPLLPWRLPEKSRIVADGNGVENALITVRDCLVKDLKRMMLARQMFSQVLMYARHRIKAE